MLFLSFEVHTACGVKALWYLNCYYRRQNHNLHGIKMRSNFPRNVGIVESVANDKFREFDKHYDQTTHNSTMKSSYCLRGVCTRNDLSLLFCSFVLNFQNVSNIAMRFRCFRIIEITVHVSLQTNSMMHVRKNVRAAQLRWIWWREIIILWDWDWYERHIRSFTEYRIKSI